MKNLTSFFSFAFILPFLALDFFHGTAPANVSETPVTEAAEYQMAVVMFYQDENGEQKFMMPEEFIVDIPNEEKFYVLSSEGTFYNKEDNTEIDFEAIAKLTGLDKKAKSLNHSYNGIKISKAHYFVYNNAQLGYSCSNKAEKFSAFIDGCFLQKEYFLPRNCHSGIKKCKCKRAENIEYYPCYLCHDEPEFSINCDAF